jgi:hypothetical protein
MPSQGKRRNAISVKELEDVKPAEAQDTNKSKSKPWICGVAQPNAAPENSLDRSGGSVFRIKLGAAKVE